ncbi:MAG TPA: mycofactocin system transcriptional regulator [Acidimicrobiales bacterium]|nr:mycofactocin system transcriptional regulator [Acidimicrobiales bacterium]
MTGRPPATVSPGRPPATTAADLEHVALGLFTRQGFEETTVDQIAAAAGIGRRTFFRYYRSKNDVAWGDFDEQLARFRASFQAVPASMPLPAALHDCIARFNDFPAEEEPWLRRRMALLLGVPALQAHSTLRYAAWRAVVAEFVAGRRGERPDDLVPQVTAHCALGTAVTAYECWLRDGRRSLAELMDAALAAWLGPVRRRGSAGGPPAP